MGSGILSQKESPPRLSRLPLAFAPVFIWLLYQVLQSPAPWRGEQQLVYLVEAFIVFCIFTNNVCTRAHVWTVFFAGLVPMGLGGLNAFYQFFQDPKRISDSLTEYRVELSPEYLGRARGTFADPESFAVFLLLLGPCVMFAALVPRFPGIIRVLCCYIAAMAFVALLMAQVFWALLILMVNAIVIAWLTSRRFSRRIKHALLGLALVAVVSLAFGYSHNRLRSSALASVTEGGS